MRTWGVDPSADSGSYFVVEEQLLVAPDDVREVRQKLHAVAHERAVRSLRDGLQLRAEDDRAHLQRRLFQLRHGHACLERSHQSARVLADDDLDLKPAGRKRHA